MKKKNIWIPLLSLLIFSSLFTYVTYSNSAEPPSMVFIVPKAPGDLTLTLNTIEAQTRTYKNGEKQFAFYSLNYKSEEDGLLQVSYEDISYTLTVGRPHKTYRTLYTLDVDSRTLSSGESLKRSVQLISYRLILTLLVEALVFYLFAFRSKRSWLVFLSVNLISQGGLNIYLNGSGPFESYVILVLLFGEFWVFLGEMIVLPLFINEKKKWVTVVYALLANFLSLIAGILLIGLLPV